MCHSRAEALSRPECLELLAQVPVGRIGASIGALPVILPVTFALFEQDIVFRAVRGTEIGPATNGAVVAFAADLYADDLSSGWSVLVRGLAAEIRDPHELSRAADVAMVPWIDDAQAHPLVRIPTTLISGRRFGPIEGAPRLNA